MRTGHRVLRPSSFVLLLLVIALLTWVPVSKVQAQFAGQPVSTLSFSVPAGTLISRTFVIPNRGQVAHTIQVVYGQAVAHCATILQASMDNASWFTLLAVPNINATNNTQVGQANGYFTYLRITTNSNQASGCTVSTSGTYTGYAVALPPQPTIYNAPHIDIAASVTLTPAIEYPASQILTGFSCHNPNNSTAYLEIMDRNPPPAGLGSFILYQIGIPAEQTFVYPGPPIYSGSALSAGAATAASGVVAVGVPLVCDFALNINGPFGPILGMPNRL